MSVFSRLHPLFVQRPLLTGLGNFAVSQTVAIDLTLSAVAQRSLFRRDHRRQINRLRRSDVTCVQDAERAYLGEFRSIYYETMRRVGAAERYFFPATYFDRLAQALGSRLRHFVCFQDNRAILAGLFVVCQGILQYHLGGTRDAALALAPLKLLLDEVRLWATDQGLRVFHLGGGATRQPDDSLLFFKKGFSDRTHEFAAWRGSCSPTFINNCWRTSCAATRDNPPPRRPISSRRIAVRPFRLVTGHWTGRFQIGPPFSRRMAVKLRELQRDDLHLVNASRRSRGGHMRRRASPSSGRGGSEWLNRYLTQRHNNVRLAILDDDNEPVGCVYLLDIHWVHRSAEFAILIGRKDRWKRGIGAWATRAMLRHAFDDLQLQRDVAPGLSDQQSGQAAVRAHGLSTRRHAGAGVQNGASGCRHDGDPGVETAGQRTTHNGQRT